MLMLSAVVNSANSEYTVKQGIGMTAAFFNDDIYIIC